MNCKRCSAEEDRIHGFCSIRCEELYYLEQELATVRAENARIKFDYIKMLAQLDGEIAVQKAALFASEAHVGGLIQRCALIEDENEKLRSAIAKTINDNLYLADGEDCTLIELKRAIGGQE